MTQTQFVVILTSVGFLLFSYGYVRYLTSFNPRESSGSISNHLQLLTSQAIKLKESFHRNGTTSYYQDIQENVYEKRNTHLKQVCQYVSQYGISERMFTDIVVNSEHKVQNKLIRMYLPMYNVHTTYYITAPNVFLCSWPIVPSAKLVLWPGWPFS